MKRLLFAVILSVSSVARAANPVVVIETSLGNIKVELNEEKAPITVKNFLSYVDDKFYDGTLIHRVIGKENSGKDQMIQGGGHEPGMKEKKTREPIVNESSNGLENKRGTIAMARRLRNPDGSGNGANTATAQWFINVADNAYLDKDRSFDKVGFCVFGKVTEGLDVVDKIKAVKTMTKGGHENVPVDEIVIKSIKRDVAKEPEKEKPPTSR